MVVEISQITNQRVRELATQKDDGDGVLNDTELQSVFSVLNGKVSGNDSHHYGEKLMLAGVLACTFPSIRMMEKFNKMTHEMDTFKDIIKYSVKRWKPMYLLLGGAAVGCLIGKCIDNKQRNNWIEGKEELKTLAGMPTDNS